MNPATIADAIDKFATLTELLDNAYWECTEIADKDFIYNIISVVHQESTELNKLSIQDHHYPYEVITERIHRIIPNLIELRDHCGEILLRTTSAYEVEEMTEQVLNILAEHDRELGDIK